MRTRNENSLKGVRTVLALLVVLGVALLVRAGSAQSLIPVSPVCGQTLSSPGQYVLTGDMVCAGPVNGVNITSSDVTFHLAGHSISNPICDPGAESVGIFVRGGITNVQVEGGKVTGFNDGIVLDATRSQVVGMTVSNACIFGILGQGQDNRIERNVVTGSGDGVALVPSRRTRVFANDLSGNLRAGVAISDGATDNIIEHNILNNNGSTGEGYGVVVFNGSGNLIENNTANKNDFGIRLSGVGGNQVRKNTVSGNVRLGIWITLNGGPSTVRGNTVLGSGETDMVDENSGCDANKWRSNVFQTDRVAAMPDGGPSAGCIR